MKKQITEHELELIKRVANEHEEEFREWSKENREKLVEWYDTKPYPTTFQTIGEFAYYCASEFMKDKDGKVEGI